MQKRDTQTEQMTTNLYRKKRYCVDVGLWECGHVTCAACAHAAVDAFGDTESITEVEVMADALRSGQWICDKALTDDEAMRQCSWINKVLYYGTTGGT